MIKEARIEMKVKLLFCEDFFFDFETQHFCEVLGVLPSLPVQNVSKAWHCTSNSASDMSICTIFQQPEGWRFLNSFCEDGSGSELDQCRRLLD